MIEGVAVADEGDEVGREGTCAVEGGPDGSGEDADQGLNEDRDLLLPRVVPPP